MPTKLNMTDIRIQNDIRREHLHALSKMPDFPSKVVMGKRAVGWRLADLEAWIDSKTEGDK